MSYRFLNLKGLGINMISMKISEEEKKEMVSLQSVLDRPAYPYGLELHIDEKTFEKLGMTEPPEAGSTFMVLAKATVQDVHHSKHADDKPHIHFRLQIEELDLKPAKEEEKKSTESVLYGE